VDNFVDKCRRVGARFVCTMAEGEVFTGRFHVPLLCYAPPSVGVWLV